MYRPWASENDWDETELALHQDYAITRFYLESGRGNKRLLRLDEQEKDMQLLRRAPTDSLISGKE